MIAYFKPAAVPALLALSIIAGFSAARADFLVAIHGKPTKIIVEELRLARKTVKLESNFAAKDVVLAALAASRRNVKVNWIVHTSTSREHSRIKRIAGRTQLPRSFVISRRGYDSERYDIKVDDRDEITVTDSPSGPQINRVIKHPTPVDVFPDQLKGHTKQ